MTLRGFYLLVKQYRSEQQQQDWRFFLLVKVFAGKKDLRPGDVFPSLRDEELGEEADPQAAYDEFYKALRLASGS